MTRSEFLIKAGLGDRACTIIHSTAISEAENHYLKALAFDDEEALYREVQNKPEKLLLLFSDLAIEAADRYREQNIPEKIYWDTFSDFAIWFRAADEKGLLNARWLLRHIKLRLFKLGRLQFEIDQEKKILHIHIPATGPLKLDQCLESLEKADKFFNRSYTLLDCDSWLLSPALKELLPEESNIIKFQRLFTITSTDANNRQAEERVFGYVSSNAAKYPKETTLQKKLKAYLLSGRNAGTGYGTIERMSISSGLK